MKLYLDNRIFELQAQGGISQIWRNVTPHLKNVFYAADWHGREENIFIGTYYSAPPAGYVPIALIYDCIAERYRPIGSHHPDALDKAQAIRSAHSVIGISHWTAYDVEQFYGKPCAVAYPGTTMRRADSIQVAAFRARHNLHNPYVLVVGRRHLYKNVQALYQAWDYWSGRDTHQLVCIGGEAPDYGDNLFAQKHPGTIRHLSLSDSDMACATSGATMLVYPSLYEGFGLPVLEALACGCPVVCGAVGAIPEIGLDIPYYADVLRPLSIAQAMTAALQPDMDRLMRGMERAKLFTWERMAQQIVQAIQDIVQETVLNANLT